jgi:hypothetical protein
MSAVHRVSPPELTKKTPPASAHQPREKKPIDKAAAQDWQDALQARLETLSESLVLPVSSQLAQENSGGSEQDNDSKNPKSALGLNEKWVASDIETAATITTALLPLNMHRLGTLIAAFVTNSAVRESWAVQIPLSSAVLQDTVLHMRCELVVLTLKFETSDWSSRETLLLHTPTLMHKLRNTLPQLTEIVLLSD